MQRIRTIKPELFRHEGLFEAEKIYQLPLRLAFVGLFCCCDREGRFRWRPKQLKLDIFPYDNIDMAHVLDALMKCGFIVKYACQNELYGCIPSWHKHQCVNHRESPSLLPGFDESSVVLDASQNDASGTRGARVNDASMTRGSPDHDALTRRDSRDHDTLTTCGSTVEHVCQDELREGIHSCHKHPHTNHPESVSLPSGFDESSVVLEASQNDASGTRDSRVNDASGACLGMPGGNWKGNGTGNGKGRELEREHTVHHALVTREPPDRDALTTREPPVLDALTIIFAHWKNRTGLTHAVLDKKRREVIQNALSMGYTAQQLCQAIDGCSQTPHNMGNNDKGERYDGLHIVFRDADQIDRFIRNFYQPPQLQKSQKIGGKREQASIKNLQNWLDKKTQASRHSEETVWAEIASKEMEEEK